MKKWTLILFMSSVLLMMIGFPGLYDSKRRAEASHRYYDSPSETTQKELAEAKAGDKKDILVYEAIMGAIFAAALIVYVRFEKQTHID